jgi:hypothetical protein
MKIKTNELSLAALNWAVSKCFGYADGFPKSLLGKRVKGFGHEQIEWHPSTDWALGGPIIEREKIKVAPNIGGSWSAQIRHTKVHPLVEHRVLDGWTNASGETPLIAAMRCYVASKMGDEVDVPDDLLSLSEGGNRG